VLTACSPQAPNTGSQPPNTARSSTPDCEMGKTPGRFDRECTAKALHDARQAAAECGLRGHVKTTFAPTGRVEAVVVEPSDADARAMSCVEERFREARIPPYVGQPVSIGIAIP
jgi:hypothetical protein